jgi:peptidoglycan/xylan/chitin deacetylase (PgdA/CDA1 family)
MTINTLNKPKIALRIDDIGASTKKYEVYSKKWFGIGNFLFLKYTKFFKAWGVYREMNADEWYEIFNLLEKYNAKLTIAVTATWVEYDGSMIRYDKKFPKEADAIKYGVSLGVIEIANHGLTHCVIKNKLFRPRLFSSNRSYHREFWEWLGRDVNFDHVKKSQEILTTIFETKIVTLVPPGNVYCDYTVEAARKFNLKYINCQTRDDEIKGIKIVSNTRVYAFHDKEVVENGIDWFEDILIKYQSHEFKFIKELN